MPTDKYGQGVPYLDYSDRPDLVLLGQGLADGLAGRSVMRFPDPFTRDDVITAPVAGMLTWIADADRYEYYDGSDWQSVEPPHVAMHNGSVSVSSSPTTYTALDLGSQVASNRTDMVDGAHPTRLLAPTAGTYLVHGYMLWDSTLGTADGRGEFRLNGTGTVAATARFGIVRGSAGNAAGVASGVLVFLTPGYAEVFANQNSGGTVSINFAVGMHRISTST